MLKRWGSLLWALVYYAIAPPTLLLLAKGGVWVVRSITEDRFDAAVNKWIDERGLMGVVISSVLAHPILAIVIFLLAYIALLGTVAAAQEYRGARPPQQRIEVEHPVGDHIVTADGCQHSGGERQCSPGGTPPAN